MESPVTPILWFVLILALIPAALWLLKRVPGVASHQTASSRVVGILPLSGSQRILTVEVGQGEGRVWLVLGVTPSSITLLHTLPPTGEVPATAGTPTAFSETLKRLVKSREDRA